MNIQKLIPDWLRTRIIQFLVSEIGSKAVPLISGLVAIGITKVTSVIPQVAALIDQEALVTVIWVSLVALVNLCTNKWLTEDAKTIQQALVKVGAELKIDGWVGDATVTAFEQQTGIPVMRATAVEPREDETVSDTPPAP